MLNEFDLDQILEHLPSVRLGYSSSKAWVVAAFFKTFPEDLAGIEIH